MKKSLFSSTVVALLTLSLSTSMRAQDNTLTEQETKDGWELLFDGKSMDKWKNFKKDSINEKWQIIDGAMTLTAGGGKDLMTKKEYKNFELKLDWKISEGANSGIFILADEKGPQIYTNAPEIQIIDNEKYKEKTKDSEKSGSLYDLIASPKESHKATGEWNSVKISLKDKHLQVWQNDVLTIDIVIGGEKWQELVGKSKFKTWKGFGANEAGAIGLQDHGNPVSFKNIKIKVLD